MAQVIVAPTVSEHNVENPMQPQPPPPPPTAFPPPQMPGTPPPTDPGERWQDRLPFVAAVAGAGLLVAGLAALLITTWDGLDPLVQGGVLALVASLLSAGATHIDTDGRNDWHRPAASLVFASSTALLIAAVTVATSELLAGRVSIGVAGLVGAAHAGWAWSRHLASSGRMGVFAGTLVAGAGPAGTGLSDRWTDMLFLSEDVLEAPISGLVDVTVTTEVYLIPAAGWVLVAAALLATSSRLSGQVRVTTTLVASLIAFGAALGVNVSAVPLASFGALLIVGAYTSYGAAARRKELLWAGGVGTVLVALRVLVSLLGGQITVIAASVGSGVVLLSWAMWALSRQRDGEPPSEVVREEEASPGG